jgi:hypothetical protein
VAPHRRRSAFTVALAAAFVCPSCTDTPAIVGEWLVSSRDSVDVTMEFLANGTVRMHRYYVGHDTARRAAIRQADSAAQARYDEVATFWTIRLDSVCVLGATMVGTSDCGVYRIRDDGPVRVLQVRDEPPWPRYRRR